MARPSTHRATACDVAHSLLSGADTIYRLGPLTKGFTTCRARDARRRRQAGVDDAHQNHPARLPARRRAEPLHGELERADALWAQAANNILVGADQAMAIAAQLRAVTPFHGAFRYNNWGYEVAGRLVEAVSSQTYAAFLAERIFGPLGMARTSNDVADTAGRDGNVARGYMCLDDGTPCAAPRPRFAQGTAMNAGERDPEQRA